MRRRVIAGNWKMYKTIADTRAFFAAFSPPIAHANYCDIVVAPPFVSVPAAVESARSTKISIAGQNVYWEKEGAFTGEISPIMLREAGGRYVIIGHSERRQIFGETDEMVARKTKAALAAGLTPIVCVGETLAERESGHTERVCEAQLSNGPGALAAEEFCRLLMAYEPVWAIGTGRTATPGIAGASHRYLRQCVAKRFSPEQAAPLGILSGCSVKPDNIQGLMA